MNLGVCLADLGDLPSARQTYEASLNEFESLIAEGRSELRPDLALTRINLGICLDNLGDLPSARSAYEASLSEFEALIAEGRSELRPDLALTRMNLGICFDNLGDIPATRQIYEASLNEYEALVTEGRSDLRPDLANMHMNFAAYHLNNRIDLHATKTHYHESLTLAQSLQAEGQLFLEAILIIEQVADWHHRPNRPAGTDKPRAYELATTGLGWLDTLLARISDPAKGHLIEQNIDLFHLAADLALDLNWADENITDRVANCDPVFVPPIFFSLKIRRLQNDRSWNEANPVC